MSNSIFFHFSEDYNYNNKYYKYYNNLFNALLFFLTYYYDKINKLITFIMIQKLKNVNFKIFPFFRELIIITIIIIIIIIFFHCSLIVKGLNYIYTNFY